MFALEEKEGKVDEKKTLLGDCGSGKVELDEDMNRIYFYSVVDIDKVLELSKNIIKLNMKLTQLKNNLSLPDGSLSIDLHINSGGGSLLSGFSAVNYIKNSKIPVTSVIDGYSASAATLMSVVAPRRYMRKYSFMLIHQLSNGFSGKYEELKDHCQNSDLFMNIIYKIYDEHAKIPQKVLKEVLKRDVWFTPQECLKYGLVDKIID